MKQDELTGKVLSGGLWLFVGRGIYRLFSVLKLVILARILSPDDFGLFGIALLSLSVLDIFSKLGFQEKLIQELEDIEKDINTVWTLSIIRGFLLGFILFFTAPFIGVFFKNKAAVGVVRLMALSPTISGFLNPRVVYFSKRLEFKKQMLYDISGVAVEFVVAVILALVYRNVMALIIGNISGNFLRLILSFILFDSNLKVQIVKESFSKIFGFGKWVWASSIIVFLNTEGDDIFVGKVLGSTMLGFYQMAYKISMLVLTDVTDVIKKIVYPVFSKLQLDKTSLSKWFYSSFYFNVLMVIPFSLTMFFFTDDIVRLVLGDKWLPLSSTLKILSLAGGVRSIFSISGSLFYARNKPGVDAFVLIIGLFVLGVCIYPLAIRYGIYGVSWAVLLSMLVSGVVYFIWLKKELQISVFKCSLFVIYATLVYLVLYIVFAFISDNFIFSVISTNVVYFLVAIILFKRILEGL